ncbi:MAG: hypothetical protein KJO31_18475 [Gammaproteobacteria bacterium]|nr:hypothetical protein [Gammaproteobacteria bacterium]
MSDNPYETPKAELGNRAETGTRLTHLKQGQRFIIYAFILYFVAVIGAALLPLVGVAIILIAFILGIIGVFRAMLGVDYPLLAKIVLGVLIFVPLLNILVLLALNSRVTQLLRDAGYTVGFFGVRD